MAHYMPRFVFTPWFCVSSSARQLLATTPLQSSPFARLSEKAVEMSTGGDGLTIETLQAARRDEPAATTTRRCPRVRRRHHDWALGDDAACNNLVLAYYSTKMPVFNVVTKRAYGAAGVVMPDCRDPRMRVALAERRLGIAATQGKQQAQHTSSRSFGPSNRATPYHITKYIPFLLMKASFANMMKHESGIGTRLPGCAAQCVVDSMSIGNELLRAQEQGDLAGRPLPAVFGLQLQQESIDGTSTSTSTVTTTVTMCITVHTSPPPTLTPMPGLFLDPYEATSAMDQRLWMVTAPDRGRMTESFSGLVLWIALVILQDYWINGY
ncbi:Uu.00g119020.m01.CDS01 [Anthostomella pinea]|uniref:Uu.00g119020.m01.CDS01 n=1 Tax=Anthostomella pinea TaxID=933095 RepID=A0AAI8VGG5_9PEZI|nr:Uu.00g119020.m01.CDS01 [Anthostomella pinea]